jgi:hypothetical protein
MSCPREVIGVANADFLPQAVIRRVDAAISASLQAELIEVLTGKNLSQQTPYELSEMLRVLVRIKRK